jgi:hypothetical protein
LALFFVLVSPAGERLGQGHGQGPDFFLTHSLSLHPRVNSIVIQGPNTSLNELDDNHAKAAHSPLFLEPSVANTTSFISYLQGEASAISDGLIPRQRLFSGPWGIEVNVPFTKWHTATRLEREPGSLILLKDGSIPKS